jgi:protein-tyrosine-phosphatase
VSDHPRVRANVVFVCAHGAAKSVIARERFLEAARRLNLDVTAVARGIDADAEVPAHVQAGLRESGIAGPFAPPVNLHDDDLHAATHVVAFDQPEVGDRARAAGTTCEAWNGAPAVSDGYDAAAAHIEARVVDLARRLAAAD